MSHQLSKQQLQEAHKRSFNSLERALDKLLEGGEVWIAETAQKDQLTAAEERLKHYILVLKDCTRNTRWTSGELNKVSKEEFQQSLKDIVETIAIILDPPREPTVFSRGWDRIKLFWSKL